MDGAGYAPRHVPVEGPNLWDAYLRSSRRNAAREAVKRRAAGLDREQVERILDEVFVERGLPPPHGASRELLIDQILHPPTKLDRLRITADFGLAAGKGAVRGIRWLREHRGHETATDDDEGLDVEDDVDGDFVVRLPRDVEVQLDSAGRRAIESFAAGSFWPTMVRVSRVELRLLAGGSVEVWSEGEDPIRYGSIDAADAAELLPQLDEARLAGRRATAYATRVRVHDRPWALFLNSLRQALER